MESLLKDLLSEMLQLCLAFWLGGLYEATSKIFPTSICAPSSKLQGDCSFGNYAKQSS